MYPAHHAKYVYYHHYPDPLQLVIYQVLVIFIIIIFVINIIIIFIITDIFFIIIF